MSVWRGWRYRCMASPTAGQAPLDPMGLVVGGMVPQVIAAHYQSNGQPKPPDHPQPLSYCLLSMASILLEPLPLAAMGQPQTQG